MKKKESFFSGLVESILIRGESTVWMVPRSKVSYLAQLVASAYALIVQAVNATRGAKKHY